MPQGPRKIRSNTTTAFAPGTATIAEAKAHLSSLVTHVERKRTPVTILRRGVAVAQIVPLDQSRTSLFGSMRGTVEVLGDIVGPTGVEWTLKEHCE